MESPQLEMLRSVRGRDMLLVAGFLYHYDEMTKHSYRWVCTHRNRSHCHVRIHTNLIDPRDLTRHKLERTLGEHNHGPAEPREINRAREKKREADEKGLPCTLEAEKQKEEMQKDQDDDAADGWGNDSDSDYALDEEHKKNESAEQKNTSPKPVEGAGSAGEKKVLMLKTAKGCHMIAVQGCVYRLDGKSLVSSTYRWKCFRFKDLQCTGRVYTECLTSGLHRYKAFREEENKHNHAPYNKTQLAVLIKRNTIKIIRGKEDINVIPVVPAAKELKSKIGAKDKLPLVAKRPLGPDDDTDYDDEAEQDPFSKPPTTKKPRLGSRKERADATSAMYRYVKDPMKALKTPREGEVKLFSYLPSQQGKLVLIMDNMIFYVHSKANRNDCIYWTCLDRKDKMVNCNCRLTTENSGDNIRIVRVSGDHNHALDHRDKIEKKLKMNVSLTGEIGRPTFGRDIDDDGFGGNADDDDYFGDKHDSSKDDINALINRIIEDEEDSPSINESAGMEKKFTPSPRKANQMQEEEKKPSTIKPRQLRGSRKAQAEATAARYRFVRNPREVLNNPPEAEIKLFTYLPSQQGRKVLILEKMIYYLHSKGGRNESVYWTCLNRKDKHINCNARLITQNVGDKIQIIKVTGEHTHTFDHLRQIERKLKMNVNIKEEGVDDNNDDEEADDFGGDDHFYGGGDEDDDQDSYETKKANVSEFLCLNYIKKEEKTEEPPKDWNKVSLSLKEEMDPLFGTTEHVEIQTIENNQFLAEHSEDEDQNYIPLPKETAEKKRTIKSQRYSEDDDEEDEGDFDDDQDEDYVVSKAMSRKVLQTTAANPDNMDISKTFKLRSAKGGVVLCVDGYVYNMKSFSAATKRSYWACVKSKANSLKCPARVTTVQTKDRKIQVIRVTNSHTHEVCEDDIKKRLYNEFSKLSDTRKLMRSKDLSLDELKPEFGQLLRGKGLSTSTPIRTRKKIINMKLYAVSDGPPSLAVRMCLKALELPYELHNVDYIASEHLSEEYAKLNPQREIPVLDDNGFHLSESVAIMQYLCDKYAADSPLYPKEAKERALVNHRLCFNMAFYYSSIGAYSMAPIFFDYQRTEMGKKKVENALQVFETYLKKLGTKYAAGNQLTIADLALVSATLCLEGIAYDFSKYQLVSKWYQTFKQEYPQLWEIANGGMQEIAEFEHNPPDLSHMNHPFHPTRKSKA